LSSSDSSEFSDALAEFMESYERLHKQMLWREMLGLDESDPPRNKGLKGVSALQGIFDEAGPEVEWWDWRKKPERFTPKEFQEMWDSYTEVQKINYVRVLLDRG
jgi:hypothetical protein